MLYAKYPKNNKKTTTKKTKTKKQNNIPLAEPF
jgi:hypothetical protein